MAVEHFCRARDLANSRVGARNLPLLRAARSLFKISCRTFADFRTSSCRLQVHLLIFWLHEHRRRGITWSAIVDDDKAGVVLLRCI